MKIIYIIGSIFSTMYRSLCLIICLTFGITLHGQTIFKISDHSYEYELRSVTHTKWSILSSAINFAKSHGVSPYDYGRSTGNLIAPSWSIRNDFPGFGQGTIYYWESWRTYDEEPIYIIEESNESLALKVPLNSMKEFFDYHDNTGVSFNEMMEYIKGMEEGIAEYSGCTFIIKIEEEWSPCTTTWYPYAVINIVKSNLSGEVENLPAGVYERNVKY